MNRKNTLLWVAGGVLVAWYLMRSRKLKRSTHFARQGPPRRQAATEAVQRAEQTAEQIVASTSFVPDMPTDQEVYKAAQKYCR
jgi:phage protein U